jgi:hypothetical protein
VAEALTPPAGAPEPPRRSQHAHRFALLIGALIGIALAAVTAAAILIASGRPAPDTSWSAWQPSNSGVDAAQEIADHVAQQYRLSNGQPLVAVVGGKLEIAKLPVHVALDSNGAYSFVDGESMLFTFCGASTRCTIDGTPSVERMLLLQREALEMALYAFRYTDVDNIVVLLPPSIKSTTTAPPKAGTSVKVKRNNTALLLQRSQFKQSLETPLRQTVPADTPSVETIRAAPETRYVQLALAKSLYRMKIVQGQDLSAFLVLSPL